MLSEINGWSKEEIALSFYFLSRNIRPKTLFHLLQLRGYYRSLCEIERQIVTVAREFPRLRSSDGFWDTHAVDYWINTLVGNYMSLLELIRFSEKDAQLVAEVNI